MKKSISRLLIFAAIVLIAGAGISLYLYNKPHRQVAGEKPLLSIQADSLFTQYSTDEAKANTMYLDKILQVEGEVSEIIQNEQGEPMLVLKPAGQPFGVNCTMEASQKEKLKQIRVGQKVVLKGICTGMLMDVVMVKCVLVESNS